MNIFFKKIQGSKKKDKCLISAGSESSCWKNRCAYNYKYTINLIVFLPSSYPSSATERICKSRGENIFRIYFWYCYFFLLCPELSELRNQMFVGEIDGHEQMDILRTLSSFDPEKGRRHVVLTTWNFNSIDCDDLQGVSNKGHEFRK